MGEEVRIEISEYSFLGAHWRHIKSFAHSFCQKLHRLGLLMSAVLIMSTVTTKKCKALDDGARQEFDRAPVIPTNVIFDLILPFLYDRRTWNSICSVNKELHDDGMERTPPWPETKVYLGRSQDHGTRSSLKFSPCGSFLANGASLLSICDRRRGRITCLIGHTSSIRHLSFSKDGKYLASSGADNSIRIWPTNPTTGLPQQSDKTLLGTKALLHAWISHPTTRISW